MSLGVTFFLTVPWDDDRTANGLQTMLKELWRKLETDFIQPGFSTSDAYAGLAGARNLCPSIVRSRVFPHITHTGEFHLERLTALLKVRYGKAFETDSDESGDEALRDLICYAGRIQDQDVQRELLLFYLNCSPVIQEFLRSETTLGDDNPLFW